MIEVDGKSFASGLCFMVEQCQMKTTVASRTSNMLEKANKSIRLLYSLGKLDQII